ncbi:MAG: YkgJ family cysteine cluster protein [Gemmatimonadales bacterium]
MAAFELIPLVTIAEFEAIRCNQCGDCCEQFTMRQSPFELANSAAQLHRWDAHQLAYPPGEVRAEKAWHRWAKEAPIPLRSLPHFDHDTPWEYRCRFFVRDDPDHGHCGVYEARPPMCSNYPYGRPSTFDRCSWNVEIDLSIPDGTV